MSVSIILFLGALRLGTPQSQNFTSNEIYYELPRFWTNTGFCPPGGINQKDMTAGLLSDAMQMALRQVAALPLGAITHVRIHWLLELVEFVQYTQSGIPIYNFDNLDMFLMNLDDMDLFPVIEFMANPGNVFVSNPNRNEYLWEDFAYQVTKHYLNILGASKVTKWRFESWNEPDLRVYNRLNFTVEDYLGYVTALRRGLTSAGSRPVNTLHFALRGPAGLFRSEQIHPLCWKILKECNALEKDCPFEVLTYHRKGNGLASEVVHESSTLLQTIFDKFPNLQEIPISNDEADPISDWSQPRDFQEDVRYAAALIGVVLEHWTAKLHQSEFKNLESISHDNAFLSYHPFEFSQRSLLAHFRMNNSQQPYSQFIQKPVYAALGLLSKLAPLAADVELLKHLNGQQIRLLRTTTENPDRIDLSWLLLPSENATYFEADFNLYLRLPIPMSVSKTFAYIIEILDQETTNPALLWHAHGAPPYPNFDLRESMRRRQTPKLLTVGALLQSKVEIPIGQFKMPWIVLLRVCANNTARCVKPHKLELTGITNGEVLLLWRELPNMTNCLKTYEVWFQKNNSLDWKHISQGWHLPFPSFQFAPKDGEVNGFYKVRAVDAFNGTCEFSEPVEYFEY